MSGESSSVVGWTAGISYDCTGVFSTCQEEGGIPLSSNVFVVTPSSDPTECVCSL